jgi:hypothetical protein
MGRFAGVRGAIGSAILSVALAGAVGCSAGGSGQAPVLPPPPPAQFKLSVSVSGQGTVADGAALSCTSDCSATFTENATVTLRAVPAGSQVFTGWTGDCSGTGACSVRVTRDLHVGARFDPLQRTLMVAIQGQGTVRSTPSGVACPGTCAATFPSGTQVALSASPRAGGTFTGWSGACTGKASCEIRLAADATATAAFEMGPPIPVQLAVTVQGAGSVTSAPAVINCPGTCSASFAAGTAVTLSASPATGWQFSNWSGACTGTGPCQLSLAADSAVVATFSPASGPTRVLTVSSQGAGTITSDPAGISCSGGGAGTCSAAFPTGTPVTVKAAPAAGSAFAGWSGACRAAYDCKLVLASDTSVAAAFAAAPPFVAADWTFYGAQQGLPSHVIGVSADASGNLWVAGGEEGLFVLRPGAATFQRFTMADGLRPYGYMFDGSAPPGTPYLNVLSVAGGPANTVFVGYLGKPVGSDIYACESNWDGPNPDPSIYKSGDADKVTLIGNGISVVHYDIFSGRDVVRDEPQGREKLCNVLRIVYDPAQDSVWFGANHGFAWGRASFQGNPTCNGQLGCAGVWEHVHPAISAWKDETATGKPDVLTGDYYGVAIDPVTHDTWFGGANRSTKFHYATTGQNYWQASILTEDKQSISNRIDVWPDKVQEPDIPKPSDRIDDSVSGMAGMQDGTAWVGSSHLGLAQLDGNGAIRGYVRDQLAFAHVGSVAADTFTPAGQTQSVWIGQRWMGGLVRIAGGSVTKFGASALGDVANSPVRDIQMQGTGPSRRVLIAFENGVVGIYSGR